MTSSRASGPRQVPAPPNSRAGGPQSRFIAREDLAEFSNWRPGSLAGQPSDSPRAAAASTAPAASSDARSATQAARQAGYQDGYRDGLVALDSFKQGYARQVSSQVAALVTALVDQLERLEQQMADGVARSATLLARQVVRSELATRPELVAQVAQDAVNAVLLSARHISVSVHPQDHALIAEGASEALAARGARLLSRPDLQRGGCWVESDAGSIDATVATRWNQAVQALATGVDWDASDAPGTPAAA